MRRRWIFENGELVEVAHHYMEPVAPLVMPDIKPYVSMVDGSVINSRSRHREHLKANGCVEIGTEKITPRADLRKTGVKTALVDALGRAKEQHGSRHVERSITDALNAAHEIQRRRNG